MMAPPQLSPFSGDGDVDLFVAEARRILANVSMDEGTAVEWLLQALRGCAREEVLPRLGEDLKTPSDVLEALLATFGQQTLPGEILAKFYSRRQGKHEALLTYAQDIQQLVAKANRHHPGSLSDAQLRDRFVEGIQSASLRREVRRLCQNEGVTYLQARAEALRWLEDEEMTTDDAIIQQTVTQGRDTALETLHKQVQLLTEQVAQAQKQQRATNTSMECWYCHKMGHTKAECRKRQRDTAQQAGHTQFQGNC
mgnify:CR=1 FL=1